MFVLTLLAGLAVSSFAANGPTDPGGKGNGILGFGFGPGIEWHGKGFGPAILFHYDYSIWKAGPGSISLGGQIGTSFFKDWINTGFVFRGAYHYGWKVPGLDTYAGFGMGTRVGFHTKKNDVHVDVLPTGFFGCSYFFNDIVGINSEAGYNFAYISIGLNFRIVKK